jgi:hypothetical protein
MWTAGVSPACGRDGRGPGSERYLSAMIQMPFQFSGGGLSL